MKPRFDPQGLLNPGKLRSWAAAPGAVRPPTVILPSLVFKIPFLKKPRPARQGEAR